MNLMDILRRWLHSGSVAVTPEAEKDVQRRRAAHFQQYLDELRIQSDILGRWASSERRRQPKE